MTEPEAAWVAGLFEGEGWVGISKGKYPYMMVRMTDLDVIERLQRTVGCGNVRTLAKTPDGNKPVHVWDKMGDEAVSSIFRQIEPWLGTRRINRFTDVLAKVQ